MIQKKNTYRNSASRNRRNLRGRNQAEASLSDLDPLLRWVTQLYTVPRASSLFNTFLLIIEALPQRPHTQRPHRDGDGEGPHPTEASVAAETQPMAVLCGATAGYGR